MENEGRVPVVKWIVGMSLLMLGIFLLGAVQISKGTWEGNRQKSCFANLRIMRAAIETYNQENPSKISHMDLDVFQRLIAEQRMIINGKPMSRLPSCPGSFPRIDSRWLRWTKMFRRNLSTLGLGFLGYFLNPVFPPDYVIGTYTFIVTDGEIRAICTQCGDPDNP